MSNISQDDNSPQGASSMSNQDANWSQLVTEVEKLQFDIRGAAQSFSARLKSELGWDDAAVNRAMGEYRRFLCLAASCDAALVPSKTVDQVWQVHLLYSRHYISGLCAQTLKKLVHRKPAGADFSVDSAYARTLELYEQKFGERPDWDGAAASYSIVQAFPESTLARTGQSSEASERRALEASYRAAEANRSDGGSGTGIFLLYYILMINGSYNADSQSHGSGASGNVLDPLQSGAGTSANLSAGSGDGGASSQQASQPSHHHSSGHHHSQPAQHHSSPISDYGSGGGGFGGGGFGGGSFGGSSCGGGL